MKKSSLFFLIFVSLIISNSVNAQWQSVFYDTINKPIFHDIQFLNNDTGFVVAQVTNSSDGYLLRTNNGGISWDTTWFPYKLNSVFFLNDSLGYSCGFHSYVYKTINGGDSWNLCDTSHFSNSFHNFNVLWFKDNDTGVVAYLNNVYFTFDGGLTFTKDSLIVKNTDQMFSNDYGIWSRIANVILHSNSIEVPFNSIDSIQPCNCSIEDIFFLNNQVGFSTGIGWYGSPNFNYGVIASTLNAGQNWSFSEFSNVYMFLDLFFINNVGYAVGQGYESKYRFWKTEDAGQTWWHQNSDSLPYTNIVSKVTCLNDNLCYAVGWNCIYKTTNGGGPLISMDASQMELNKKQINIFPNPVQTTLTISFPESFATKNATIYKIVDKLGREVKNGKIETTSCSVSVEELPTGLYVIVVQGDDFVEQMKFVKEN